MWKVFWFEPYGSATKSKTGRTHFSSIWVMAERNLVNILYWWIVLVHSNMFWTCGWHKCKASTYISFHGFWVTLAWYLQILHQIGLARSFFTKFVLQGNFSESQDGWAAASLSLPIHLMLGSSWCLHSYTCWCTCWWICWCIRLHLMMLMLYDMVWTALVCMDCCGMAW